MQNENFSIESYEDSEKIDSEKKANVEIERTGISSFNYEAHIIRLKNRISKLKKLEEKTEAEKK